MIVEILGKHLEKRMLEGQTRFLLDGFAENELQAAIDDGEAMKKVIDEIGLIRPTRFLNLRHIPSTLVRNVEPLLLEAVDNKLSGSQAFNNHVEKILSEEDRKNNTTRNLQRLIESECYRLKLENEGKYPDRSRHKTEAKKKKYMEEQEAKYQKALAKEADKC
ncbi:MAG: hypothetical protein Q9181_007715 [Wetmoreana brouardii]